MKFKAIASMLVVSVSALILGACSAEGDNPGYEYMPDMYRSPAIEPYVDYGEIRGRENVDYKSRQSAMTPPMGTIPFLAGADSAEVRLMLPYNRKPSLQFKTTHGIAGFDFSLMDEYTLAAGDLVNPLTLTAENSESIFKSGKDIYTAMCQHCHGEKGDGQGPMVVSGAYQGVPNYTERASLSSGQIFYSIYYGKGMMGAHNSLLSKKEIWTLVHYVRKFQNADYGKFDESGKPMAVAAAMTGDTLKK